MTNNDTNMTNLLRNLIYCNEVIIGIEKDKLSKFYKLKHMIISHLYHHNDKYPTLRVFIDSFDIQDDKIKLLNVAITNKSNGACAHFHIPINSNNDRNKFGISKIIYEQLPQYEYIPGEKYESDDKTIWNEKYIQLRDFAIKEKIINEYDDDLKTAANNKDWEKFIKLFNLRYKKYHLSNALLGNRKNLMCEMFHKKSHKQIYRVEKIKFMGNYKSYVNRLMRSNI